MSNLHDANESIAYVNVFSDELYSALSPELNVNPSGIVTATTIFFFSSRL